MHDPRLAARVLRDAPIAVVVVDLDGAICHANARFERLTGLSFSELQGSSWVGAFFPEAERPRICALMQKDGGTIDEISELVTAAGEVRYLHWNVDALRDDDGRLTGWVAVAQDVTVRHRRFLAEGDERRRVLETLHERDELLRATVEAAPLALFAIDRDGRYRLAEGNALKKLGIAPGQLVGRSAIELYGHVPKFVDHLRRAVAGETISVTARFGERSYEVTFGPLRDEAGTAVGTVGLALDVTEKELLLREIHHRVKNNLQVISSLLYFHERRLHAPEDIAGIADLRRRLVSMALVHERLHRSPDVGRVDFGEYVRMLVHAIGQSFADREAVRVDVDCDLVWLPIEQAVPCGMILNELLTSVWKQVFDGAGDRHAAIAVHGVDDRFVLTVVDHGDGALGHLSEPHDGPSGWDLVHALVEQLGGDVTVTSDDGTRVRVTFPAR